MNHTKYYLGAYVKLNTQDEWNGMFGIIINITDDMIFVFCMNKSDCNYMVKREDAENILELVKFK